MATRLRLGVNIDHVATVRNARGGEWPDPVRAAHLAITAGADSITAHLREDRRHIRDDDIARLKAELKVPLNLEMAATDEMLAIALKTKPHAACLVPEKRMERTTEGGLDVVRGFDTLKPFIEQLNDAGIRVSLFIEPETSAIEAAAKLGAPVVELHTGAWCDSVASANIEKAAAVFTKLETGANLAQRLGLEVHAGHGLNYDTSETLAAVAAFSEFNTGHFLIGEAIFVGLDASIRRVRAAMDRGRAKVS